MRLFPVETPEAVVDSSLRVEPPKQTHADITWADGYTWADNYTWTDGYTFATSWPPA
ncbi:hypothetical protein [Haloarchaeobius sp. HME9146]|uniref:hypothetical protein n=1 Tax=Haloarchaeobius sp. HME9146 TaxID=2978732 RepID=UPI0021BE9653|nr:hypothetical protein [Haloarchaeobius sp. HME9146]MCT9094661.1 hypothetical protein [Haloarchaeobius sp. HME9146]